MSWMKRWYTEEQLAGPHCSTCHHPAHDADRCPQDNCGSSEIVHLNQMAGAFLAKDSQGRIRPDSWWSRTYQVMRAPKGWS